MPLLDQLVVATDAAEVASLCRSLGARTELTSAEHRSGTERVAEVAIRPAYREHDVILNIQGDEPLVRESHLRAAVELVASGKWPLGTCAAPLAECDFDDPAAVKVGTDHDGAALWFDRALPDGISDETLRDGRVGRHLGIYSYSPSGLANWVSLDPVEAERERSLEQLRPLAHGIAMGVARVSAAAPSVDTPGDVPKVEAMLREEPLTGEVGPEMT